VASLWIEGTESQFWVCGEEARTPFQIAGPFGTQQDADLLASRLVQLIQEWVRESMRSTG